MKKNKSWSKLLESCKIWCFETYVAQSVECWKMIMSGVEYSLLLVIHSTIVDLWYKATVRLFESFEIIRFRVFKISRWYRNLFLSNRIRFKRESSTCQKLNSSLNQSYSHDSLWMRKLYVFSNRSIFKRMAIFVRINANSLRESFWYLPDSL